jgi:hypothetical protein
MGYHPAEPRLFRAYRTPPPGAWLPPDPSSSCYRRGVRHRVRSLLLLLLVAAALAPSGCSATDCTEMGCSSLAVIEGELPAPNGAVTVTACRNGACNTLSDAAAAGCQTVSSQPWIEVCFVAGATLGINVAIYHDGSAPPLANGDLYTLEVRDASGATLVDFSGSATYREHRPNGDGCDPICKTAELSL